MHINNTDAENVSRLLYGIFLLFFFVVVGVVVVHQANKQIHAQLGNSIHIFIFIKFTPSHPFSPSAVLK